MVGTELELEVVATTVGEAIARGPGAELAIAEELFSVRRALELDSAPVAVAGTELDVVLATAGVSGTSGSAATKTKATVWAAEKLPPEGSEGAVEEESAARTEKLLIGARSVLGIKVVLLLSISVTLAREAL